MNQGDAVTSGLPVGPQALVEMIEQAAKRETRHIDQRRAVLWDVIGEEMPELFDSYGDPDWKSIDTIDRLHAPYVSALTAAKLASGPSKPLKGVRDTMRRWLARPHYYSPYVDAVAVRRALEGEEQVFIGLTALETRVFLRVLSRLGWNTWRFGNTEKAADIRATYGRVNHVGAQSQGPRAELLQGWNEDRLIHIGRTIKALVDEEG